MFPSLPFYNQLEENVYHLCKKLWTRGTEGQGSDLFVVFISNEKKQIPLWNQKASQRAEGLTLWDYHVICVEKKEGDSPLLVWDLDSTLQFPCPLASYVSEAIKPSIQLFSEFQRFFRIVHAPIFLRSFASDRRHMKDSEGNWMYEPPEHDPIVAEDGTVHNLNEYMTMSAADTVKAIEPQLVNAVRSQKLGVLIGETQLEEFFSLLS
ncbi:hypothetical protein DCAR_0625908 [Daucus carota subsp. sativus]|uniref:Protein N-terminal glutamine amidohydrolase n=1 Tax=Daucus carota subsp. sativus TaxID=79200 RepID=A0AAF0XEA7_DAUCS|nr:hypothetical protein DCAR_0625908 [Daucus carota subsp. sativus]